MGLRRPADSWSNWAGNQQASGPSILRPRGTDAVAEALVAAAAESHRVRPIGSGHSFTAIGRPDVVQLRLDRYDRLLSSTPGPGWSPSRPKCRRRPL